MGEKFKYKYVAPTIEERKEIESIKREYLPKEDSMTKLERLRYLDNLVKTIPMILGLSFGVIGLLIFGTGMVFFLEWVNLWYLGIPFSILGIVLIAYAYPVYVKKLKKNKEKYGKEIIELSEELLDEKNE
ncbi:MAG: dihydropteridine reductase [Bacilli bacterium]|nr:dihydropteridine reductase [Bacilli bacterium]